MSASCSGSDCWCRQRDEITVTYIRPEFNGLGPVPVRLISRDEAKAIFGLCECVPTVTELVQSGTQAEHDA